MKWFLLVEGPQGSGKTTLIQTVSKGSPNLALWVSVAKLNEQQVRSLKNRIVQAITHGNDVLLESVDGADLEPYVKLAEEAQAQARYIYARVQCKVEQ